MRPPINSPINAYTYSPTALHVLKLCRHNFEHASYENSAGIKVLSHVSVFWGRERVQAKYNTHFLSVTWTWCMLKLLATVSSVSNSNTAFATINSQVDSLTYFSVLGKVQ